MTRVFVSGAIANKPGNGGGAWTRMSYVIGFRRLGFETYFVEQIGPGLCTDQWGSITSFSDSINRRHFREVVNSFGVAGAAALVGPSERMEGMSYADLLEAADGADLLVNISGHLSVPRLRRAFRRAVYIDLDPGFTQIWHAQGNQGPRLAGHDAYFTVGTNVGTAACAIPIDGIQWIPTLPPVVLEDWPVHDTPEPHRFTTIAAWRGPFGPVTHDGRTYGLKVHEFRKVAALPQRTGREFELALSIHPADERDRRMLLEHGWRVVDPEQVVPGPAEFRSYVHGSWAEFSVAQGIYVDSRSGWFSDRTVRYLASGKPVLVQDTGFGRTLPIGEGLLAFRTLDQAVANAEEIASDYERHAKAARAIAEEYFDSDRVLSQMLERMGVSP